MSEEYYKNRVEQYGMGHTRRERILQLLGGSDLRVLDIGCGNGSLGARVRELGNWVEGIELSDAALQTARERLDQVWQFDLTKPWPEEVRDMDVVIAAEVLEHMFDPVSVLQHAARSLKPGGHLIVTTPNFLTWTNRLRFLVGRFTYQTEGMFDFGHIRWFTYSYLREVLDAAGFELEEERHIIFPGKLGALLKYWPSLFAWQFVVRARKR